MKITVLELLLVVLAVAVLCLGCGRIEEVPEDAGGNLRGRLGAGGGEVQESAGGAPAGLGGAPPGTGGSQGTGGASAGLGGALAAGTGGASPAATFAQPGSSCDALTGAQVGGGNCGPNRNCQWQCSQAGGPEWEGAGLGTCTGDVYQGGRSCAGGPCGPVKWSNGASQMLNCAVGTTCTALAAERTFPAAQDGGATATTWYECRRYCLRDEDCGAGRCAREDLPCARAGGAAGRAPAPIPGVGLCAGEDQVWTCDRVGPLPAQ